MALRLQPPCSGPLQPQPLRGTPCAGLCSTSGRLALAQPRHASICRRQVSCPAAGRGGDKPPQNALSWMFNRGKELLNIGRESGDPQQADRAERAQQPDGGADPSGSSPSEDSQQELAIQPASSSQIVSSARQPGGEKPERQSNSFESWREYIERMDTAALSTAELDQQLQQAVAFERYNEAAEIRKQIEALLVEDTVGNAHQELDDLLDEERYEEAARLRDEAYTSMEGWWAGRGEDDPYGHLLFVQQGFGCYKGAAYLPRNLMEIREYVNSGQVREDDVEGVLMGMGHPLMEVFLRKEQPSGRLKHCATAIVPADTSDYVSFDGGSNSDGSSSSGSGSDSETGLPEGLQIIQAGGNPFDPDSIQSDDPEVAEVLKNLHDQVISQLQDALQSIQNQDTGDRDAFSDITDPQAVVPGPDSLPKISRADISDALKNGGGSIDLGEGTGVVHVEVQTPGSAPAMEMARGAADMRRFGRNRFAIQALKEQGEAPEWVDEGDEDERVAALLRTDEEGLSEAAQRRLQELSAQKPKRVFNVQSAADARSALPLLDLLIGDAEETQGMDQEDPQMPGRLKDLRERVSQRLQRIEGVPGPTQLNDLIKQVIKDLQAEQKAEDRQAEQKAEEAAADGGGKGSISKRRRSRLASGVAKIGREHKVDPAALWKGRIMYTRIPAGVPATDPFCGTFMAAFGPHGVELLQVGRTKAANGHEVVTARKLTGDPNVPAGQVSFTARVDRGARLDTSEYPEMMGVTGRYPGRGLIAQPGFKDPKWVDGELLQFTEGSPLVQGARLGFVWTYPGTPAKRFLVLLNRIGLDEDADDN